MNRAIISQRITSILAEIERLNNALYAMNTTDIQRYPYLSGGDCDQNQQQRLELFVLYHG